MLLTVAKEVGRNLTGYSLPGVKDLDSIRECARVRVRKENGKSRNDWKSIDIKINGLRLMGGPTLVSK